jgi:hypothetical protein
MVSPEHLYRIGVLKYLKWVLGAYYKSIQTDTASAVGCCYLLLPFEVRVL